MVILQERDKAVFSSIVSVKRAVVGMVIKQLLDEAEQH